MVKENRDDKKELNGYERAIKYMGVFGGTQSFAIILGIIFPLSKHKKGGSLKPHTYYHKCYVLSNHNYFEGNSNLSSLEFGS